VNIWRLERIVKMEDTGVELIGVPKCTWKDPLPGDFKNNDSTERGEVSKDSCCKVLGGLNIVSTKIEGHGNHYLGRQST
jgi:hypothetical protein